MWHVRRKDETVTFNDKEFKQQLAKGFIRSKDQCWTSGMEDFVPAYKLTSINRYVKPVKQNIDFTIKGVYLYCLLGFFGYPWIKLRRPVIAHCYMILMPALWITAITMVCMKTRNTEAIIAVCNPFIVWKISVLISAIHITMTVGTMSQEDLEEYVNKADRIQIGPKNPYIEQYKDDETIEDVFATRMILKKQREAKEQKEQFIQYQKEQRLESIRLEKEYRKLEKQQQIEDKRNEIKQLKEALAVYKELTTDQQERLATGDTDLARLIQEQIKAQRATTSAINSMNAGNYARALWDIK